MIESRRWPSWIETRSSSWFHDPVRVGTPVCDPFGHDVHELGTIGLLVTAGDTAHLNLRGPVEEQGSRLATRVSCAPLTYSFRRPGQALALKPYPPVGGHQQ